MIKVAIANDTLIALEALRRAIATDEAYELVWTARSGQAAIALATKHPPDLILMDLLMPGIDGVEATRQIMARSPCAILIVTGSVCRNTSKVFEAMGCGALDVVQTPVMSVRQDVATTAKPLLAKMLTVTKFIGKYRRPRREPRSNPEKNPERNPKKKTKKKTSYQAAEYPATEMVSAASPTTRTSSPDPVEKLVIIGASTGGPRALAQIFSQLSPHFAAAIVVVQHIDSQFTAGLAGWLNRQSVLPVALAQRGDRPRSGQILLAQAGEHLIMQRDRTLSYTRDVSPTSDLYCPSVDVFFNSVAQHWAPPGTAVLLTGMGRDGAAGLSTLRTASWQTIAESKQSCVVYGMPRAAIENGAAGYILAVDEMAAVITQKPVRANI